MKPRVNARIVMGILLIAMLSLLLPQGVVQAQQPTSADKPYTPPRWPLVDVGIKYGDPSSYDFFDKHTGFDAKGKNGDPVYSVCKGTVIWWGDWPWEGKGSLMNTIWIDCGNGDYYSFSHLSDKLDHLVANDPVEQGQVIGYVGIIAESGYGSSDHLHFGKTITGLDPRTVKQLTEWVWEDPMLKIDQSVDPTTLPTTPTFPKLPAIAVPPTILFEKSYNMRANYGSYPIYRENMLMTLWGVSPGSKFKDAYLSVPGEFEGQVLIPEGTTWLNGIFGPYTHSFGMGDSEVGGIKEGGGACDILSMVAESIDKAYPLGPDGIDKILVDHMSPHPSRIPGVDLKYSLAVATRKNLEDSTSQNGADVRVVNTYGPITLHWKVSGDTLTLTVTAGANSIIHPASTVPPTITEAPAKVLKSVKTISGGVLLVIAILLALLTLPRFIVGIGKPKSKGEVAERKSLWRETIELTVIIGIGLVVAAVFYAQWQWPENVAYYRRIILDFWNGSSSVPNYLSITILFLWFGTSLLRRLRESRMMMYVDVKKKPAFKPLVLITLVIVGALLGTYLFPSIYVPAPPVRAEDAIPAGSCDGVLFAKILNGSPYQGAVPPEARWTTLDAAIGKITPQLEAVYKEAERKTGVPCEVLAGIHFVEGNNRPNASLISGRTIGVAEPDQGGTVYSSLLESAIAAAKVLKGKAGLPKETYAEFTSAEQLITALNNYNGKGNRNCQDDYTVNGAAVKIPYSGCPALFKGEDHPAVMNWLDSKHTTMYLLYCADNTACAPQVWKRPGYLTVANWFYSQVTSRRDDSTLTPTPTP